MRVGDGTKEIMSFGEFSAYLEISEILWCLLVLLVPYCWFAHDVTVAMLVVKNKSISPLWELNSIFM